MVEGIGTFSWSEGLPKNSHFSVMSAIYYIYLHIYIYTYIHIHLAYIRYNRVSYNKMSCIHIIFYFRDTNGHSRRSGCGVAQWNRYRSGRWGVGETRVVCRLNQGSSCFYIGPSFKFYLQYGVVGTPWGTVRLCFSFLTTFRETTRLQSQSEGQNMSRI